MKLAILAGAACFLGFCIGGNSDQAPKDSSASSAPIYEQMKSSTLYESRFQPTGRMGSYLSANFAQRRFDWDAAFQHMESVLDTSGEVDTGNDVMYRRAMMVAIGAGHYDEGFALANKILGHSDDESLAHIVKSIALLKQGDYPAVSEEISTMPEDGLSRFLEPILTGWLGAHEGTLDVEALTGLSIFNAQAILIAGYLDKKDEMLPLLEQAMRARDLKIVDIELIADGLTHIGEHERAKQLYEQILKIAAEYKVVQDKLATLEAGETPDYFEGVSSIEEGTGRAFYDLARLLYHQGNDETAQFVTQLSHYLNPNAVKNAILLGSIAASNDQKKRAIGYYSQVPKGDSEYLSTQREIANLFEDLERHSEAIATLETLANDYGDIESLIKIGDIYRRQKDFDKAVKAYDRAEAALGQDGITDDFWHLHYVRGMAYEQNGQWVNAQSDLEAALKFRPDNAFVLNYLGYAWADQDTNLDKAQEMIERAVELEPTDGYITDSLGWVLYRRGDYKEAVAYLERAVALLPYDPIINDHLGDAYWQVGRRIEARFQWERARNHAEDSDTKLLSFIEEKLENGLTDSLVIKQAGANYDDKIGGLQTP